MAKTGQQKTAFAAKVAFFPIVLHYVSIRNKVKIWGENYGE
jgi:hypothetical protein